MKFLLKGSSNIGLLVLRVLMGLGIASHGFQKLFTPGILDKFTAGVERLGFPAPGFFAWLAALSEFAGGIFIALGLGTRLAALFVFFTMCVAFFRAHAADPFSVKEPAMLYGVMALTLMFAGAGSLSLDQILFRPRKPVTDSLQQSEQSI